MKRFQFKVLSAIIILFFLSPVDLFSYDEGVAGLLQKMGDETLRSTYQGERYIFDFNSSEPKIIRYRIIHRKDGFEKKVIISLDNSKPQRIILKDKENLWEYIPSQKKVIKMAADPAEERIYTLLKNISLIKENYSTSTVDGIAIAGRDSTLIEFIPKNNEKRSRYKIWVDKETGLALRTEIYNPENRLTLLSFFSKIDYTIPPAEENFVLMVPKNTSLKAVKTRENMELVSLDSLVDFTTLLPKYLPKGFVIAGGRVKSYQTSKELHIHYSDGLSGISLFENSSGKFYTQKHKPVKTVDINDVKGNFYQVGNIRILEWKKNGITLALVGEIAEDEFLKIARSIE
jgi:negative regulator of sigma E activity